MGDSHPIFKDVSRETLDKLYLYESLLRKWQSKINLIGPSTVDHIWHRHFLDSAQLMPLIPSRETIIVDIGSGAGFPGLVLAILGYCHVHLVESDQRKCAFLKEVARQTQTGISIHHQRIEQFSLPHIDIITSRACSSLSKLINMLWHLMEKNPICLFHKGKKYTKELEELTGWSYHLNVRPSQTDDSGVILEFSNITRA